MAARFLRVLIVAVALYAAPAAFGATPVAEVRGPDGDLIASASSAPFAYPADGSVLRIGSVASTAAGLELRGVSVLGEAVRVGRLVVPQRGVSGASVRNLTVDGRAEAGNANTLLSLDGSSYLIVLQQAVVPGSAAGVVGLRLYVGEAQRGLPAGTQIMVGLARATLEAPAEEAKAQPWRLLGIVSRIATPTVTAFQGIADPFAAIQESSPMGERAVALAQQFLGVPYVWGGASPSGFDCSGLVMFVYQQLGVGLPHYSGNQWYAGRRLAADELQPGDIVFFDMGPDGPGHEGLYIGDGKFIEAPHTGAVVRISDLFDPARGLSYVGAVRPY
jgi:cell wall-associated NlpC family hydrolase